MGNFHDAYRRRARGAALTDPGPTKAEVEAEIARYQAKLGRGEKLTEEEDVALFYARKTLEFRAYRD